MPVQFNVAQLLQAEIGSIRHHEVDLPAHRIDDSVELVAPLIGKLKLTRTNRGILADADFSTELRFDCSRCLTDVVVPIHTRFTEEYYPTVDLRSGLQAAVPEGGSGYMLSESHELDLTEPTRQAILLENPMKPLCRADCLGLCQHCGHDLNSGPCQCEAQPADGRLGQLAEWLKSNRLH